MNPTKRLFDLVISLPLLLLCAPILIVTAILVKLDSPGSILFKQQRVGFKGKSFELLKFRSMVIHQADANQQTYLDDPKVTRVGHFIRRFKIDELPQLINVICGEMSLVGPRPTLPDQVKQYTEYQRHRLDMLPGLTGWAQVNGNILLSWDERIEYDLYYIEHWSLLFDLRVLLLTISVVLFGEKRREGRNK